MLKAIDREDVKGRQKKDTLNTREERMTIDVSAETSTSQKSTKCHLQHAERKNCQSRFLHATKISLNNFSGQKKKMVKEFFTNRLALEEILKEIFRWNGNDT